MKKILLISDTHGHLDKNLFKHINEADEVWHGGDIGDLDLVKQIEKLKPFKAVYGNIDGTPVRALYPENLIFICEELKVFITHIGGYPGKYPARIKQEFQTHKPQLFICGHSHILKVMYDKDYQLLHINPGAAGAFGFHHIKTAVKFDVEGKDIKNLAVIEFGKRTAIE